MTGAQTDVVSVPLYLQATCLLLKVTPRLFGRIMSGPDGIDPDDWGEEPNTEDIIFRRWFALRDIISRIQERRSMELTGQEAEALSGCLIFAHGLEHEHQAEYSGPADCPCQTAAIIRQLKTVLEEGRLSNA